MEVGRGWGGEGEWNNKKYKNIGLKPEISCSISDPLRLQENGKFFNFKALT